MKIIKLSLLLLLGLFVLSACDSDTTITEPSSANGMNMIKTVTMMDPVQYPLTAGQHINIGNMSVYNDAQNLYITFNTTGDWMLKATHLHVGRSLNDIPKNRQGIPVIGRFAYQKTHSPFVTTQTYEIPLASLNLTYGTMIYVAAHAEAVRSLDGVTILQEETAFGGDIAGSGVRWWFYFTYTIKEPNNAPPTFNTETAMIRMNDLANDFSYRWGSHPWFSYVKLIPTEQSQTFYFYAAQHNRVGEVDIWKDSSKLYVKVMLDAPYSMTESHLNVQLTGYSGTPSFGRFPYKATHTPNVTSYTYQVDWKPTWTNQLLNISLHGVVGPF